MSGARLAAAPTQRSRPEPPATRKTGASDGARIIDLAAVRAGALALPPNPSAARRPRRAGAVSAEHAMAANTGQSLGAETWRERAQMRAQLAEQTASIAAALERQGITCHTPSTVVAVGDVTRQAEGLEAWRAIRILPLVAQRDRRPLLNALRYYHHNDPGGRYIRMAVITSGRRVPLLGPLKERQRDHTRDVSRWAHEARKDWRVEVLFRGTEFTVTPDGVHLHSNILLRPLVALPKDVWREFLRWTRRRLGGVQWRDCGRLQKPEEAIKYAVKPADLVGLADEVLAWLHHETYRAKHAQPMGAFAEFCADLDADRVKVAMVHQGGRAGARLELVEKPRRDPAEGGSGPGENMLVARTLPQSRFSPWAEPCSLVMNWTPSPTTPDGWRRLAVLNARTVEARAWWDAAGAPEPAVAVAAGQGQAAAQAGRAQAVLPFPGAAGTPPAGGGRFKVHTCRPTVQVTGGGTPPPGPDPGPTRTALEADGTVYDPDTGEILLQAPKGRREEQAAAAKRAQERADVAVAVTAPGVTARTRGHAEVYARAEHIPW